MKTTFHTFIVSMILLATLASLPSPVLAIDPSLRLYQGGNEPDGIPAGQTTFNIFYDQSFIYSYSGGPVCLSSQDGQCTSPAIDDEAVITVNGTVLTYPSYTSAFGPVDFTPYLHIGNNQVRVQLIDRIGPNRGGSPLWLVSENISDLEVIVQRNGNFFSPDGSGGDIPIEAQPRASVPFIVTVRRDGSPVVATLQQLQPFNAFGGTTNSNGISNGSLAISIPPQNGDVLIQYQATVNGITSTSVPALLYHVDTLHTWETTITQDDEDSWGSALFIYYTLQGSIPSPDIPNWRNSGNLIDFLRTLLQVGITYLEYRPIAGDNASITVYRFSAPGMTTAYLYREVATRNGNIAMERNYFTTDFSKIQDTLNPDIFDPTHRGLNVRVASPTTLYVTDPNGISSGVDPTTGLEVFGFPMALSRIGDEPYRAFVPGGPNGEYVIQVVGTGSGLFTFSTNSLTHEGIATPTLSVTGQTHLGYITTFVVDYQSDTSTPVTLFVTGTVDIVPETLNLGSKSGPNSVTAFIELPLGFDVRQVDLNTITLAGSIPAQLAPTSIGDHNNNGIPDLMVKFDRRLLVNYLRSNHLHGNDVELTIEGNYTSNVLFTATDALTVIK